MNKKYIIYSLAVLSMLGINADIEAYERQGCSGGVCNSGCGAPTSSYGGFNDGDGPYYDHRGPDIEHLRREGHFPNRGAKIPENKNFSAFQGELPQTPSTGDRHHYFNPAAVSMFKGDVVSVTRIEGRRGQLVRVVIKTNQGDDVEVRLGPASFFEKKNFVIREGDKINIKGSKVNRDGRTVIIAQEIQRDNDRIVLRDKDGRPEWHDDEDQGSDSSDRHSYGMRSDHRYGHSGTVLGAAYGDSESSSLDRSSSDSFSEGSSYSSPNAPYSSSGTTSSPSSSVYSGTSSLYNDSTSSYSSSTPSTKSYSDSYSTSPQTRSFRRSEESSYSSSGTTSSPSSSGYSGKSSLYNDSTSSYSSSPSTKSYSDSYSTSPQTRSFGRTAPYSGTVNSPGASYTQDPTLYSDSGSTYMHSSPRYSGSSHSHQYSHQGTPYTREYNKGSSVMRSYKTEAYGSDVPVRGYRTQPYSYDNYTYSDGYNSDGYTYDGANSGSVYSFQPYEGYGCNQGCSSDHMQGYGSGSYGYDSRNYSSNVRRYNREPATYNQGTGEFFNDSSSGSMKGNRTDSNSRSFFNK